MEIEIVTGILEEGDLHTETFHFLIKLMGYRNQLRMNHWQTHSYAEHKLTDDVMEVLGEFIDSIGEAALGQFGRPKVNTVSTNVQDIALASTEFILTLINDNTFQLMKKYKETDHEGIFALLSELDAHNKKHLFLCTLGA